MATISGLKLVFSFILLSLFFFLFGLPSWTKFEAKQTIVLETTNDQDGNADPAITVCANNGLSGWRKNTSSIEGGKVFQTMCNQSTNAKDCINRVRLTYPRFSPFNDNCVPTKPDNVHNDS